MSDTDAVQASGKIGKRGLMVRTEVGGRSSIVVWIRGRVVWTYKQGAWCIKRVWVNRHKDGMGWDRIGGIETVSKEEKRNQPRQKQTSVNSVILVDPQPPFPDVRHLNERTTPRKTACSRTRDALLLRRIAGCRMNGT